MSSWDPLFFHNLSRPPSGDSQPQAQSDTGRDLEGDTERFEQALAGGETAEDQNPDTKHSQDPALPGPANLPGDAILRSFFAPAATDVPAGQEPALRDIAAEVAERLLVSDGPVDGRSEVRILLKDSVLPGTEIRISREAGSIQIAFVTFSADSARFLAEQQAALQQALQERMPRETVHVSVTREDREEDEQHSRHSSDSSEETNQ